MGLQKLPIKELKIANSPRDNTFLNNVIVYTLTLASLEINEARHVAPCMLGKLQHMPHNPRPMQ